ncbi:MAG TPA: hypothetical protein VMK65_11805 [Longimicrobiales bacterium]|nr:hypothetical protein [Longimicrobiales bacterium]
MSEPNRADTAQQILEQRDAAGAPKYDHVHQDARGHWHARRRDDHTVVERVDPERAGG